jgi:glycine dehydrogenase subunit 2
MNEGLIFERSRKGRVGFLFPALDVPEKKIAEILPDSYRRQELPPLPEVSEVDVVRHYTLLSRKNYGVDLGFYPLGSCTMKYNPKMNEAAAALPGFADVHPLQPESTAQGTLEMLYNATELLCELTGMDWGTLQPFAGAHGEFTGMKLFKAYFDSRGEEKRTKLLVPDSAHGTNPASAHIAGFEVVELKSTEDGLVSLEELDKYLDDSLAGIMLTNPNTLGLFEKDIMEIASRVHKAGGLLYYDGANMNAIMGIIRPGDMGFDVVHLNPHKTLSTPHGGGGPGSGTVFVKERLRDFLPNPDIVKEGDVYRLRNSAKSSIGRISGFYGNIAVILRAYSYLLFMGSDGLKAASERAVLNANYLKEKLKKTYHLPIDMVCMHEFVLSAKPEKDKHGFSALDIAKGLLDYGIHPPTIYFPLIVPEAMMIEPTETENLDTLNEFIEAMEEIHKQGRTNPEILKKAPLSTAVRRVDEFRAAKEPILRWFPETKTD